MDSLLNERRLKTNVEKCAVIVFGTRQSEHQLSNFRLVKQDIERVQKWNYLGVILTKKMSIVPYVDRASDAFLRQFNNVYSKFYSVSYGIPCFLFCN